MLIRSLVRQAIRRILGHPRLSVIGVRGVVRKWLIISSTVTDRTFGRVSVLVWEANVRRQAMSVAQDENDIRLLRSDGR